MKKLEKIVAGVALAGVLGATALTLANVKSYLDARKEVMAEIRRETKIEPTTMSGEILEMNGCDKIAEPYRQELRHGNFGIFKLGRRYLLQEYTNSCTSSSNVGMI